ncbi:MAG: peptidoglycan DD-metalloendopeptidase family protein, partial [Candidatus Yanofskybacteria bacterium]|nr:peptidoglycan DD-metalloendopeptidase family protein [Candidatus Yanofskybacteria bacterium]
ISIILSFVFFILFSGGAFALDDTSEQILELRKQIEELTKQAQQYRGNITQKQKEADTLKRQIDILTNQIRQLETRISITERQIGTAKIEIVDLEEKIFDTGQNIDKKRRAMGEMVQFLYERDRLSLLAALLRNPTLSTFTNQAKQAEDVSRKLVGLLVDLKNQKEILEKSRVELEQKKSELEELNQKQTTQKISLDGSKSGKDQLLTKTRGQEVKYQQLLSEVEKKKAEFFAELNKLEAEAIEKGAFIVRVTATSVPLKGSNIFRWPYEDYVLTQGYGMTSYARRGAYGGAPHNGIDIAAGAGTPIKPVMDGAILASGFNNGFGNWVAVRHPNNLVSVYAHMRSPSGLANSTPVTAGSILGYEGSTGNSTGSHLHLSVYRDFFTYINEKSNQLYFNYFDGSLNPLDYL